jgi:hypothetical protein
VTVKFSPRPAPGAFTGAPLKIPFTLFCTQGERWCGWQHTANSQKEFTVLAMSRRQHESLCRGGLIIAAR